MEEAIVFEALTDSPDTRGDGVARLPVLQVFGKEAGGDYGFAYLPPLAVEGSALVQDSGSGDGIAVLPPLYAFGSQEAGEFNAYGFVRLPPLSVVAGPATLTPSFAYGIVDLPPLTALATGFVRASSAGIATLPPLYGYGFEADPGDYGVVELPAFSALGFEAVPVPSAYVIALPRPVASVLASSTLVFTDSASFVDTVVSELLFVMRSNAAFADEYSVLGKLLMSLQDSVAARDAFAFIIERTLDDTVEFTDASTITPSAVLTLASALMVADEDLYMINALITVTSALVLADRLVYGLDLTLADDANFADVLAANQTLITTLVSEALLTDEIDGTMLLSTLITSDVEFDDDVSALLAALMELSDDALFTVRFRTPDGVAYAGYMMNIKNAAMSELTNFNFNSFWSAPGGRTFAAAEGGIYQLGGDTDDGAKIAAEVYTGLTDLGSSQLKRVPNALLGYTSDGRLMLKTVTTDGGRKKENWYELRARTADAPVDGRLDIAKGLVARYWGWKISNIDGANFQLDSLKVWPMVIQRRKSGR